MGRRVILSSATAVETTMSLERSYAGKRILVTQRKPDLSTAKTLLDWEPKIALADGLKEDRRLFQAVALNA